ncbi:MAG TPA: thymidine phosphorylase [Acidimicrobiia bacterium]|nr:thymidine phosphorylase [Acidimicrobiia bacterium]
MNAIELIERKRDGGRLSDTETQWLIRSYVDGSVADYQMAAMAMAIFLQGLDGDELAAWTLAMLRSGQVLDLGRVERPKIDKHSTGGVGDKVSIPLAPMVAACGVAVPMMSGRGLGHTGGTLDKLESIPGFRTGLDPAEFGRILEQCGLVLAGQSETLVPADRKLYALRDATGTVPSIPLIASSIMSKKLAEDLDGLVLDVKVGSGAFMKDVPRARQLATTMIDIGRNHGVPVHAVLTAMDQPLGREVGNAAEIRESIDVLRGEGPPDLVELTLLLGERMLKLAGVGGGRGALQQTIDSGAGFEKLLGVVAAQGGDPRTIEDPRLLPTARLRQTIPAPTAGVVNRCDALTIGVGAMRLGAGRERQEDSIDPAVGVTVHSKVGDRVGRGDPLATVNYNDPGRWEAARPLLESAWSLADEASAPALVIEEIG